MKEWQCKRRPNVFRPDVVLVLMLQTITKLVCLSCLIRLCFLIVFFIFFWPSMLPLPRIFFVFVFCFFVFVVVFYVLLWMYNMYLFPHPFFSGLTCVIDLEFPFDVWSLILIDSGGHAPLSCDTTYTLCQSRYAYLHIQEHLAFFLPLNMIILIILISALWVLCCWEKVNLVSEGMSHF